MAKQRGVCRGRQSSTTKAHSHRAKVLQSRGCTVPEIAYARQIRERTVFRYLTEANT